MKNKISAYLFIILTVLGCVLINIDSAPPLGILYHIGYFTAAELVVFLILCYRQKGGHIAYSSVFVLILYIFHFGQLLLYSFFQEQYSHIRFLLLLSPFEAVNGFKYMTYSLTAICSGILIRESRGGYVVSPKSEFYNRNLNWVKTAKKIINLTFFVKVILDIITLSITIIYGGDAARLFVNRFPNVFLYYGKISLVGFSFLIFIYKYQPKKQLKVFLFIEIYILVMMISGIRSENVAYLVVFLFIYISCRQIPLTLKTLILAGSASLLALTFVVAVGQFRAMSSRDMGALSQSYSDSKNNHVILGLFDTCGDTGYTGQVVVNFWLPKYGPSYGDAYYKGITAIIPNIPGLIDMGSVTAESAMSVKLQQAGLLGEYYNIGGSIIGEFYYNFGLVGGVIFSLIFGLFVGWVSTGAYNCFFYDDYYKSLLYIPMMLAMLYWVRSYFGGGIREAVWGILFAYIVVKSQKKQMINKYI